MQHLLEMVVVEVALTCHQIRPQMQQNEGNTGSISESNKSNIQKYANYMKDHQSTPCLLSRIPTALVKAEENECRTR